MQGGQWGWGSPGAAMLAPRFGVPPPPFPPSPPNPWAPPSGSVWSSYRKGCVDTVMRCIVPESSGRFVNRMSNEALHKGGEGTQGDPKKSP